jgi:type II secretory pathway pseudopilin PulG
MRRSGLGSSSGFTYVAVMVIVMLMGIMLGISGQVWRTVMQREREEELLFRGTQIRNAIERWNNPLPGQPPASRLQDIKHLLKDPRSAGSIRYLRRLYKDPITGKDFTILPPDPARGIVGVASPSEEVPLKQSNFPLIYKEFAGKQKYSDWQFIWKPFQPGAAAGAGSQTTGVTPFSGTPPPGGTQ